MVGAVVVRSSHPALAGLGCAAYMDALGQAWTGGDPSAVPLFVMLGLSLAASAAVTVRAVRWLAGR